MMNHGIALWRAACALAVVIGVVPAAWGGGFQVPTQSARAAGQGDAFTAQADDPSAIYYNPAGLTQLTGTLLSVGLYSIFPDFGFEGEGDVGDASNRERAFIPHFYLCSDLGQEDWRFGLGVNSVFGLSEDWGDDSPLRQSVTEASLSVVNIAPAVSYRVDEHLSFGAALNIYYGDLELNSRLPFPAGPEGRARVEGDDFAVGFTVGALWRINDRHALGLVYRSPFQLDLEGSSKIDRSGLPRIGPSNTNASLELPQIIVAGYAFRPSRRLTLEADVQWADWDTFDQVPLESDDPRFSSLPPRVFDFDSSFTFRFGVQYQLDRTWTLRGGYVYSPTSAPERTFTPAIVDLDTHVFTAGVGYNQPRWSLDLAYRFILGVDRDVNDSINSPPGEYSDQTHAVILTMTVRF